ncbi:glutamyl-tRNA reductase [Neobacillus sp. YIM B06451]|uniref:glutamyl-tRNA reductase n=1 Tax=Neobacillus sp. YIM B06451 TaxID=3070994 RepID=UPI002931992C|nr:glutamyl-tRNA reductase [Neobacillus sp. YIM B06451]
MHILVVGLDYKTAPLEIREKLTFNPVDNGAAMEDLQARNSIVENVILSTCNRTEIYAVVDDLHKGRYEIKEFLSEWFQIEKSKFTPFLFFHDQELAIEHLFKVACGLNSMILGETQILGQVRTSFLLAQNKNTIGKVFNYSFKKAVTLGKRAHSETGIGSNAVSVSYAAVELANKVFTSLEDKSVLLIGAGKMSELAYKNLKGNGVNKVIVINRTFENAKKLANRYVGEARPMAELLAAIGESDIIISSTSSEEYVITREMILEAKRLRKGKPLFIIDISVPRDIDPLVDDIENVFLYNIDDLRDLVNVNLMEREKAAEEVATMIEGEIIEFQEWIHLLDVVPVISALNKKTATIRSEVMNSITNKLPDLTNRDVKVIAKHVNSITNQMLKDPLAKLKALGVSKGSDKDLDMFIKIFNIEEMLEKSHRE